MKLEYEVIDLILNFKAGVSIESQIMNIKKILFDKRVRELDKIFKRVKPCTNYLFSENDGSRCVFASFNKINTLEVRLYNYRCIPIMDIYVNKLDLNNIELFLFSACASESLLIKL